MPLPTPAAFRVGQGAGSKRGSEMFQGWPLPCTLMSFLSSKAKASSRGSEAARRAGDGKDVYIYIYIYIR